MSKRALIGRREFLRTTALAITAAFPVSAGAMAAKRDVDKPNILWLVCEDMSSNLGCCGDAYAITPNINRLARQSVRYTNAYATAPVCSAARSCLITGVYATSLGTMNLRSQFPIPDYMKGFPSYLRQAGYYCTNNVKTDYNTSNEEAIIAESWDESSSTAHWRGGRKGQPFFSVFNSMLTHQSRTTIYDYSEFKEQIQDKLDLSERHDPAKAPVPPYWPDTPTTRRTIARYHDCITAMDKDHVGRILKELEEDGLAEDTIVFFYSDHGAGMPRHKRLVLDSGMLVPLIVRFPKKYKHLAPAGAGRTIKTPVSFVDFAPTVLSLTGLEIPDYMEGKAFLGEAKSKPRQYVYGARDRVDEAYDIARSVRDKRYLYVRNFMPHISYNQPEGYSDLSEVRRHITALAEQGKLNAVQMSYAGPGKALEELYDSYNDPYQINNLVGLPKYKSVLQRMRKEQRNWVLETRDLGFLPEVESWLRSKGSTPYKMARETDAYPLESILDAAELVGRRDALDKQIELLSDKEPAVRYWAAVGLSAQGKDAAAASDALMKGLSDPSAPVRIEAAGVLVYLEKSKEALSVLINSLDSENRDEVLQAARSLQMLGEKASGAIDSMQKTLKRMKELGSNHGLFVQFALEAALKKLGL